MHPLVERLRRTIRRHDLVAEGSRVVVALSGGPDSVALLHLLRELEPSGALVCAGVAHFNHQLRSEAADRDEQFCRDLADRLGLPIDVGTGDVRALARAAKTSAEDAARRARYDFLRGAAERLGASRVAIGHTRDDQAETFLLRLIRGAGSRGRRGIHPRRGIFVRPLLDIGRQELRAYLSSRHVPFCDDETNADVALVRNRVRHELLPLLQTRFSPAIVDVLAREAEIASTDEEYLSAQAREAASRIVHALPDRVVLDVPQLVAEPSALARRIVLDALRTVSRGRFAGHEHVCAILEMATRGAPDRIDLPGARADLGGSKLVLREKTGRGAPRQHAWNAFHYPLSVPGEVWLPEASCTISAESGTATDVPRGDPRVAVLAARHAPPRDWAVRNRRPGDTFRPIGLSGCKKLQDFFVDRKIVQPMRDCIPLVVDDRDRIAWIAGHAVSEDFRVTDQTQAVIILRLKSVGEAPALGQADHSPTACQDVGGKA